MNICFCCNETSFLWQNICNITSIFLCKSKTNLILLNLLQMRLSRSKFQTQAPHRDAFWPARSRSLFFIMKQSRSDTLQSNTSTFCVQHLKSSRRHHHPYFSKSLSCAFKSSSNAIGNGFAHISKRHLYWRSLHTHFIPLGCPATMTLRTNNWKWFKKICCLDHHHPAPALPLPKVLLLNRLNDQAAGRGKQGAALRAHLDVNKYRWQLFIVVSQE